MTGIPRCFSVAQWSAWVEMARREPPDRRAGYCEDCLPTHKLAMTKQGRCEHPEATIKRSRTGVFVGTLDPKACIEETEAKRMISMARATYERKRRARVLAERERMAKRLLEVAKEFGGPFFTEDLAKKADMPDAAARKALVYLAETKRVSYQRKKSAAGLWHVGVVDV